MRWSRAIGKQAQGACHRESALLPEHKLSYIALVPQIRVQERV